MNFLPSLQYTHILSVNILKKHVALASELFKRPGERGGGQEFKKNP